jgi:hypothetical protein
MAQRVPLAAIRTDLDQLATGGEGIVYSVRSQPQVVYKEYKVNIRPTLNVVALEELAELGSRVEPSDWSQISSRTSWPHTLVVDGVHTTGFLMNRIDKRFYKRYGLAKNPRRVLCEWNHIVYQSQPLGTGMMSEIPRLETKQKLELINDLANTIATLHRHDIIVGDISGRNLLWTLDPEPQVLIIDCDSFRVEGKPGTSPSKQSPYWTDDLALGRDTDQSSDCHKIAIAAYRAIWNDPSRPPNASDVAGSQRADVPDEIRALIAAGLASARRPSASEWVACFEKLNRFGGRVVLSTSRTPNPSSLRAEADTPRNPPERPRLKLS